MLSKKLARKIVIKKKGIVHICKSNGWWTNCELEPPCVWLEDKKARGYQWGHE